METTEKHFLLQLMKECYKALNNFISKSMLCSNWGEWFHPGVVCGKNKKLTLENEPVVRDTDTIVTLKPGYQTLVTC